MKFLNVFCLNRQAEVYISLDKIVLISKIAEGEESLVELEGAKGGDVKVAMPAEELIRKINGEDRIGIGFRRTT